MTIMDISATNKAAKTSTSDEKGRAQTVTIDGRTINVEELEPLSKQLHNPKFQEQMREAFGIPRHRKTTALDRLINMLRRRPSN